MNKTADNLLENDDFFLETILALEHEHEIVEEGRGEVLAVPFFRFCDGLPAESLAELAHYLSPGYRIALAGYARGEGREELSDALLRSPEPYIRRAVAVTATDCEVLAVLATDGDPGVRATVANNPAAGEAVLAALSEDRDFSVRCEVAHNRTAPAGLLAKLAHDGNDSVRGQVVDNPNTPDGVLVELMADSDNLIRLVATQRLVSE